jgi:hypothetical protein
MSIHREERIASLIAAAGIIWTVQFATSSDVPARMLLFPAGPLETCGIGFLLWLHAKWRRSVKVH